MAVCMFATGALDAKALCILMHYASCAGACGVESLGMRPGLSTGNYAKHLKLVLGLGDEDEQIYEVEVPLKCKYSQSRELVKVPLISPQEAICKKWALPDAELKETYRDSDWCANFHEHPVVQAAGEGNKHLVAPLALYTDSTPYTKKNGFYGVFVVDLRFDTHYLVCTLIKSEFCDCGCRGWCTLDPIQRFLVACFNDWGKRVYLERRPDSKTWLPGSDDLRKKLAGTVCECWGAVIQIRGDMPEISTSMGLKGHRSHTRPCNDCNCKFVEGDGAVGSDVSPFEWSACSLDHLPWAETPTEDWEAEIRRCDIHITIMNKAELTKIVEHLFFDKRLAGVMYKGYALDSNVTLDDTRYLLKGDRLETSDDLLDTHAIRYLKHFPVKLRFWRTTLEANLNRVGLLFYIIGVTHKTISKCSLHILLMGVISRFVAFVLWFIINSNAFDIPSARKDELLHLGMNRIRSELWAFYKVDRKKNPTSNASEIHDLTPGMIGEKSKVPQMHQCGGAEIKSLLPFCVFLLLKLNGKLPERQRGLLVRAGEAAQRYFRLVQTPDTAMSPEVVQQMFDCAIVHNKSFGQAGGVMMPKHHAWLHLIKESFWLGNPSKRSAINNESLNGTVAIVGRSVHRATFLISVLLKWGLLQKYAPQKCSGACIRTTEADD